MLGAATGPSAGPFAQLLERVHSIGQQVVEPHADDVDQQARFPEEAFVAIRQERLMSAYVPAELGGGGLNLVQLAAICEALGEYCASTAMVFAMHQIQVACMVHHGQLSEFFRDYLRQLSDHQWLLASATTEVGIGGDLTASVCAIQTSGHAIQLHKLAPVISYARQADAILVTCRRAPDAAAQDQVLVLVTREQTDLAQISGWDTLGFRGTCSSGFELEASATAEQVMPVPFGTILSQSMHPFSHILWGALWLGLANSAVKRARLAVRAQARKNPTATQLSGLRLAEVGEALHSMRSGLQQTMARYQQMLAAPDAARFDDFNFAIAVNNVKIDCSERVVDIVTKALRIVGIQGYRNDSPLSLSRQLRDAHGAALMVNNDRIRGHNATMQIVSR